MSTQKKRKKAPLGRIMYADDEIPGEIVHDPATAMACIESEPGHSGFSPYLVIDLSNPEAVVEAMAREICFVKDVYVRPIETDRKAARAVLAALGHTAKPGPTPARKVAGKEET